MRYVYSWKNNPKRLTLFNRECRVIKRGGMNSALVEFKNGQREIISRNALRKKAGWIGKLTGSISQVQTVAMKPSLFIRR